jgi:hypothetical protein
LITSDMIEYVREALAAGAHVRGIGDPSEHSVAVVYERSSS